MSKAAGSEHKTLLRRIEQYRDRWTSYGENTGIVSLSDKPSPAELREYELFQDYDDSFLERISPDISIAVWEKGATLFEEGSYIDLAFFVVEGEIEVGLESVQADTEPRPIFDLGRTGILRLDPADLSLETIKATRTSGTVHMPKVSSSGSSIGMLASVDFDLPPGSVARLGPGEVFGEIGALSGWPQSVTARTGKLSKLVQIRVPALRAMRRKSKTLKERLDHVYRERSLASQLRATPLFQRFTTTAIAALKEVVELVSCEPGEVVVREGEPADALYLVRSGFLKLMQRFGEGEIAVSYLSKGMTLGEVELLIDGVERWERTAMSVEHCELVRIPVRTLRNVMRAHPETEDLLWRWVVDRIKEVGVARRDIGHSQFTQVALESGLVQGNSVLVIDLERCTRCDDCVRACASTHGGRPRFVREGNKHDNLLIAKSCYHCRDPVCLIGCPTGAIHRAGLADVVEIDDEICIGCATCANNCPYDAIVMHETGETWPDDMVPVGLRGRQRLVASKCDLCAETGHGPACVSNCPQGCAYRVGSIDTFRDLQSSDRDE